MTAKEVRAAIQDNVAHAVCCKALENVGGNVVAHVRSKVLENIWDGVNPNPNAWANIILQVSILTTNDF